MTFFSLFRAETSCRPETDMLCWCEDHLSSVGWFYLFICSLKYIIILNHNNLVLNKQWLNNHRNEELISWTHNNILWVRTSFYNDSKEKFKWLENKESIRCSEINKIMLLSIPITTSILNKKIKQPLHSTNLITNRKKKETLSRKK